MIHAYNELYLNDAKKNLGVAFDFAINDCNIDPNEFADLFVKSGYAKLFQEGNPSIVSGRSGVELVRDLLFEVYNENCTVKAAHPFHRAPAYWAGWALADFQWCFNYTFEEIFAKVSLLDIINLYPLYHEMDISQFYDTMNERLNDANSITNLKRIREAKGLSQKELSKLADVNIRSIQMYEQRMNDINKAQVKAIYKLSTVLGCSIENLLEKPMI